MVYKCLYLSQICNIHKEDTGLSNLEKMLILGHVICNTLSTLGVFQPSEKRCPSKRGIHIFRLKIALH